MTDHLDPAPLIEALVHRYPDRLPPTVRRSIDRWRLAGGVRVDSVDQYCINHLGCHPAELYGAAWFGDAA